MADITGDIETQAVEPISVSADGQSASRAPTADLIKAQQFLDSKAAVRKRRRGLLFTKLTPPGPASDSGRSASDYTIPGY